MNVYNARRWESRQQEQQSKLQTDEGRRVRIAYLFTVNGRAVRQVLRLFKLLFNEEDYFYFHVDSRQQYMQQSLQDLERKFPDNVKVASGDERWATIWGGASLLKMLLSCIRNMINLGWKWDYVLNLSESDFLLKHPTELKDFLASNRGANFVKSHGRDTATFIKKQGLDRTFFECDNHMFRIGPRDLPGGIEMDGGSDWVCLSRDFATYILSEEPDDLLAGLFSVFNYTLLPAESFFHTALRNSRFCTTITNNNLRVTNWKRSQGCKCQHKAVVDWCGCSPNVFLESDETKIMNSQNRDVFFGRKFEPSVSMAAINMAEEMIYGLPKTSEETFNKDQYWENLYHHATDEHSQFEAKSLVTMIAQECSLRIANHKKIDLVDTTAYYFRDSLDSILVQFVLDGDRFECRTKHSYSTAVKHRNGILTVGSRMDVKEQIFRNVLGAVSQDSPPQLMFQFEEEAKESEPEQGMALWFDPSGKLDFINANVVVNKTKTLDVVTPKLRSKMAGIWTVVFVMEEFTSPPIDFLMLASNYKAKNDGYDEAFMQNHDHDNLIQDVKKHKLDHEHARGIFDGVTNAFYSIVNLCSEDQMENLERCSKTDWSSLSYDEKSNLD